MVKRIPGFEDYGVDEFGAVWSFKRGTAKRLAQKTQKRGGYKEASD